MTCHRSSGSSATGGTPTPQASRSSPGLEDLSDEEIKQQIKNLQRLLEKRNKNKTSKKSLFRDSSPSDGGFPLRSSPGDMDTSFCSTAFLIRAVQGKSDRKKKGSSPSPSSSPARRFKVKDQINHVEPTIDRPPADPFPPLRGHHKPSLEKPTQGDPLKPSNAQVPADTRLGSQTRRYPALPARPQRAQSNVLEQIQPSNPKISIT